MINQNRKSKSKTMVALAISLLICTTALIPMSEVEEAEAAIISPVTTLGIGFAVGLVVGFTLGYSLKDPVQGVTDPDVNDNYKNLELRNIRSLVTTSNAMAGSMIPSDANMLSFTSSHWNRTIEYSVADAWSLDATYDPNALLERNLTQTSLSTYLYNWQHALDNSYGQIGKQQELWTVYDIYDDCDVSLTYDNGNLWTGNEGRIDFVTAVSHSSGADKVYLRAVDENGNAFVSSGDKHIYVLGEPVRLTTPKGLFVDIAPGKHNMSNLLLSNGTNLTTGTYTVSGEGIIAGAFSAAGQNSAEISGAIISESEIVNLVRASGDKLEVVDYTGQTELIDDLAFNLTYKDRHNEIHTVLADGDGGTTIGDVIIAWDGMQKRVADLLERASTAGTVLWELYDLAETSRDDEGNLVFVSPSSIIPNNQGIELDPQIQIAMSVSALKQAGDYYASNVTALESMNLDISLNGSSVICYGDIYLNGILIAENTVYSPFSYENDMKLTAGETVDMNQSGVAIIYGQTDDFDSFLMAPVGSITMLPLGTGMSLTTERISLEGEDVEEYNLVLNRIVEHTTEIPDPTEPTMPIEVVNLNMLIVIMIIELGIILALIGYITNQRVFYLVALVLMVAGILIPDVFTKVILGLIK